ncbi:MAG: 50S ribosomal protein L7/L12 [Microgenomates group bacterium GW2011_GWA1_48_10]|nr:MAG: 50S ribosomal protein L7/L12 [Microgenomates group bacterium GW2011_GWA1_48_10]
MAKQTKDEIIEAISNLSVLELSELVKALEEKFGVSAMPVAATAPAGASQSGAEEGADAPEQTTFNVVLTAVGDNKIGVIKAVREVVPTLGLAEAKALVESAPKEVLTGVNKATAEEAKKKLESAGAKVELK